MAEPPDTLTPALALAGRTPQEIAEIKAKLLQPPTQEEIDASPQGMYWGTGKAPPKPTATLGGIFSAAFTGGLGAALAKGVLGMITGKGDNSLPSLFGAGLVGAFSSAAKHVSSGGKEGGFKTGLEAGGVFQLIGGDDPGIGSVALGLAAPYILPGLTKQLMKIIGYAPTPSTDNRTPGVLPGALTGIHS